MTPTRKLRNVPASIHQRLLNLGYQQGIRFNLLLQRYAMERFLYRLSASDEVDRFTLKGAALLRVWTRQELRPTRDIDFLAAGPEDHSAVRTSFETICSVSCLEDGVVFDPGTLQLHDIRHEDQHHGVRARLTGYLGRARLPLQVDIGFGDVITPERRERDYPTLLDLPVPRLWTYPRETLVAEKFHAMVQRGTRNTRMKDFWDIACLARRFPFNGETVRAAIEATFNRQQTLLAGDRPVALLPEYYEDTQRNQRWQVLRRTIAADVDGPADFEDVGRELEAFLGPVCDSLLDDRPFAQMWPAGGPWAPTVADPTGDEGA